MKDKNDSDQLMKPGSESVNRDKINLQKQATTIGQLCREIKHRKKKQQIMEYECERNRQLIGAVPSILIGIDSRGRITLWNQPAEAMFGIKSGMAVGKSFTLIEINHWNWNIIDEAIQSTCGLFESTLDTIKYINSDGAEVFLNFTVNSALEDGQYSGFLLIGSDVTEKLRLKGQLQIAQKMEAIGELAAGIAHEINTPLQFINDNLHFLDDSFQDLNDLIGRYQALKHSCIDAKLLPELLEQMEKVDQKADIDFIKDEIPLAISQSIEGIAKAATIVGAMKEFSHPGSKERSLCDIHGILDAVITVSKNEWKYVADLVTDYDEQIMPISIYPELNQTFLNVIINAVHAIEDKIAGNPLEKGQITIKTKQKQDTVCIKISDTGSGISENYITRIFDPFFTTKEVGKGTGQGLSISYDIIVNKHQGLLDVESEIGVGTTFHIELPIAAA